MYIFSSLLLCLEFSWIEVYEFFSLSIYVGEGKYSFSSTFLGLVTEACELNQQDINGGKRLFGYTWEPTNEVAGSLSG